MEYYQMTINDWLAMKQKLQAELLGVRRSFVRIGYILRKIDESKGYENDGYKSIAEWARGEYGLEGTTVSRFMSINREYSIGGFSEELLPEFEDFKRSQLEEMLKLPVADREMIRPETARQDIRDLKQFNKQEPAAGVADDIHQLVQKFFDENDTILKEVYAVIGNVEAMKEVVNPSGNRSYRKGAFFLMMYEDGIKLKKFGGSPESYSWQQFFDFMTDIYGMELEKEEEHEYIAVVEDPQVEQGTEEALEDAESGSEGDYHSNEPAKESIDAERGEDDEHYQGDGDPGEPEEGDAETDAEKPEDSGRDGEEERPGAEGCGDEQGSGEMEQGETETDPDVEEHGESDKPQAEESTEEEEVDEIGETDEIGASENDHCAGAKTLERLEKEDISEDENSTFMNAPEIVEKPFGSRKDYMDSLTAWGMALYLKREMDAIKGCLYDPKVLEEYLKAPVNDQGYPWEE